MATAANLFTVGMKPNYQAKFCKKNQVKPTYTFRVISLDVYISEIRAYVKTFVLLCYRFGGKNRNSISARLMATAAG